LAHRPPDAGFQDDRRFLGIKQYPKEQFQTEIESWRHLPSQNFEFTMKRLREPVEAGD
jgi:hypothetical protein